MQAPHLVFISIERDEPGNEFIIERAEQKVKDKFSRIAARIVEKDLLNRPLTKGRAKKLKEKIEKEIETEERMKSVKGFMSLWNHWRDFYYNLPPMRVKTRGQLTSIENAIEFCNDEEFELSLMIACLHKAYMKRTMRPSYSNIVSYGADLYDRFYDSVMADIDREDLAYRSKM